MYDIVTAMDALYTAVAHATGDGRNGHATTDDGLPVGVQIIGRPGADADVLCAAAALEQARPEPPTRPRL